MLKFHNINLNIFFIIAILITKKQFLNFQNIKSIVTQKNANLLPFVVYKIKH